MRTPILILWLLPFLAPSLPAQSAEDVDAIVDELTSLRDEAERERIWDLANLPSREAALGLCEVYDVMGSLYMRREVIRALANFDGVLDAEEPALEKLMDIATESREAEVRGWAVDSIAACTHIGKSFLVRIVEAPADDVVRETAMERHVELADESDYDWYRELYFGRSDDDDEPEETEGDVPVERARRLGVVRELAFLGLLPDLSADELMKAVSDRRRRIRALALEELGRRGVDEAFDLARDKFERVDEHYEVRIAAARVLARQADKRLVDEFVDEGTDGQTPRALRYALADLVAEHASERVIEKLVKKLGRGKAYEKLFMMRVLEDVEDEKIDKVLRKMLLDKDLEIRIAAAERLGNREVDDEDTVEALEKMLDRSDDDLTTQAGMQALSAILEGDPSWIERLEEYARGESVLIRNGALAELARVQGMEVFDLLDESLAHPNWSTRLAAARALASLRTPEAVGAIIGRLEHEEGLQLTRFLDLLFRLTGQPFDRNLSAWQAWWEREGEGFEVISEAEYQRRLEEEEARRLKQVTTTQFFGIQIESERVIFIIDVSGSMSELTAPRYAGEKGEPRIEVAKRELIAAIEALEPGTLFNVIIFSGGVGYWLDGDISESDGVSREEAKEFVERLGTGGGTNLYGALEAAFEDPDVDTIFVLSDGEPSVGDVIDPKAIRRHVALWNQNRGIVIHSIAVGGSLQVLEWIAEDSGGTYVRHP